MCEGRSVGVVTGCSAHRSYTMELLTNAGEDEWPPLGHAATASIGSFELVEQSEDEDCWVTDVGDWEFCDEMALGVPTLNYRLAAGTCTKMKIVGQRRSESQYARLPIMATSACSHETDVRKVAREVHFDREDHFTNWADTPSVGNTAVDAGKLLADVKFSQL